MKNRGHVELTCSRFLRKNPVICDRQAHAATLLHIKRYTSFDLFLDGEARTMAPQNTFMKAETVAAALIGKAAGDG